MPQLYNVRMEMPATRVIEMVVTADSAEEAKLLAMGSFGDDEENVKVMTDETESSDQDISNRRISSPKQIK